MMGGTNSCLWVSTNQSRLGGREGTLKRQAYKSMNLNLSIICDQYNPIKTWPGILPMHAFMLTELVLALFSCHDLQTALKLDSFSNLGDFNTYYLMFCMTCINCPSIVVVWPDSCLYFVCWFCGCLIINFFFFFSLKNYLIKWRLITARKQTSQTYTLSWKFYLLQFSQVRILITIPVSKHKYCSIWSIVEPYFNETKEYCFKTVEKKKIAWRAFELEKEKQS